MTYLKSKIVIIVMQNLMIRKLINKFREWQIMRQSAKFAKELKKKNYKPFQPWNNGVW